MTRARLRDLGITIGSMPAGPHNAITDVDGVLVGQHTLIYDEPRVARTGVTVILPRAGREAQDAVFAAAHSFNGCGEMTGLLWIEESGLLSSPIGLTNTNQVGVVRDAIVEFGAEHLGSFYYKLPVVAETYDGWLNDIDAFHVTRAHVLAALQAAASGPVAEGNVGGGTDMICHEFKGGIGTASRIAETRAGRYVLGALVQANYGARALLRVDGVPVGRELGAERVPVPWSESPMSGSIIVVLATDAPLLPSQCRRLAQRAAVGLARAGGVGHNGSGDLFLAFSTANHYPTSGTGLCDLQMLPQHFINSLFDAVAEAVEEAILNALVAADTMTGHRGRTAHALPAAELEGIMRRYGRRE